MMILLVPVKRILIAKTGTMIMINIVIIVIITGVVLLITISL